MPKRSAFEVEVAIEKLKRHRALGGRIVRSEIHKLINSIWNNEGLPGQLKESVIVPIYKKGANTYHSNYRGISLCQLHTKLYPTSFCPG
jgi:hypothetical protein